MSQVKVYPAFQALNKSTEGLVSSILMNPTDIQRTRTEVRIEKIICGKVNI